VTDTLERKFQTNVTLQRWFCRKSSRWTQK